MRVLTYNVHRCTGIDGRISPDRIADVIAALDPDIVALQEVDVRRARTRGVDQAERIARALSMKFHFNTVLRVKDPEGYGDAIMTALPTRLIKATRIPGMPRLPGVERRGALWVSVEYDGTPIQIVTTHLGLSAGERRTQVDTLFGEAWLGGPKCTGPKILLGDFNAPPRSRAYRRIIEQMDDAQALAGTGPRATYPAVMPLLALDHVFVSEHFRVLDTQVPINRLTRSASDHLPLVASLELKQPAPSAGE